MTDVAEGSTRLDGAKEEGVGERDGGEGLHEDSDQKESNNSSSHRTSEPKSLNFSEHMDAKIVEHATNGNRDSRIFSSPIPEVCKTKACVLGIDEAGRGPVCGPMVYGVAFAPLDVSAKLKKLGFADSKVLKQEQRDDFFEMIKTALHDEVGWKVDVLSPSALSRGMLDRVRYNLNEQSHDCAINLIRLCLNEGVNVTHVYVDTVGKASKYQEKLQGIFPQLTVVVESKADATYPIVSAASICAKVVRDMAIEHWQHLENIDASTEFGCGYPSDPKTVAWLAQNTHTIFGFPSVIRFSWSTATKLIDAHCVEVEWEDDDDEDDAVATKKYKRPSSQPVLDFSASSGASDLKKAKKSAAFFKNSGLTQTTKFGK